jgi:hypothetical protein
MITDNHKTFECFKITCKTGRQTRLYKVQIGLSVAHAWPSDSPFFSTYFSRPGRSYVPRYVPWYSIALNINLYAVITNVLMLLTIASVISCWRSLWQRQNSAREQEWENTELLLYVAQESGHLHEPVSFKGHNNRHDTLLYDPLSHGDMQLRSSDTPWLLSVKLMSHSSLQLIKLTFFLLFPLADEEFQLFCSKTKQRASRKYIYTHTHTRFVVWSAVTQKSSYNVL